jgi:hypothetical protein
VPFAVDEEEVAAQPVTGRPGLDRGQVDAAHRELGEDLHQRAGVVVGKERRERGPVGARRRRQFARRRDHQEPGHRVRPVVHGRDEHGQPVSLGREVAGQRPVQFSFRGPARRLAVGGERHPLPARQAGRQPAPALRFCLRVAAHGLDVVKRGSRPCQQRELDRQRGLAADQQVTAGR